MKITKDSHLDHGLSPEHLAHIEALFKDREAFFIETIRLPEELGTVPFELWGPSLCDPPIQESEVTYARRGDRAGESRLCARPGRRTSLVTVIAGPSGDDPCVLYTAYGGLGAPREPWDPSIQDNPEELAKSRAFWSVHAIGTGA